MKKKILATILAAMLALSFTACGNDSKEEKEKAKQEAQEVDSQAKELESLVNSSLSDGMAKIEEYGFKATYLNLSNKDITDIISPLDSEAARLYTITDVSALGYDKTVKVHIASESDMKAIQEENALKEKLETESAWTAVKQYGESKYPYGFDLHYLKGNIVQKASNEKTWFLRADCVITNEYGADVEMVCEAYVTGTTDAPQVIDFGIY
ncbi:MAG: hypothetical protein QM793_07895 [Muricomes sp.]